MEGAKEDISSSIIYDTAYTCLQSFDQVVAENDDSLLTRRIEKSDDISDGSSRNKNTFDFLGLRNSFLFWVDYTGALSKISSSLDTRLGGLKDVTVMVIEWLEMIIRNLHRRECRRLRADECTGTY